MSCGGKSRVIKNLSDLPSPNAPIDPEKLVKAYMLDPETGGMRVYLSPTEVFRRNHLGHMSIIKSGEALPAISARLEQYGLSLILNDRIAKKSLGSQYTTATKRYLAVVAKANVDNSQKASIIMGNTTFLQPPVATD